MLDRIYRALLGALPGDWDAHDREEMWDTYRGRVGRASEGRARTRVRWRELVDLIRTFGVVLAPRRLLDELRQDVRIGIRSLARTPLVSVVAILSLALGIGATSAIFSSIDVWLIRPLPLPNADRLVSVRMANRERGWMNNALSTRDFQDWRAASRTVELGAYARGSHNFALADRVERVQSLIVSENLPAVLGLRPQIGRGFSEREGTEGGPAVVLLSHDFWSGMLGADPAVLGRSVSLDGVLHDVIGVLGPGQGIPGLDADLWVPMRLGPDESRSNHRLLGVGLLTPGTTTDRARQELEAVADRVALLDPDGTFPDASVLPLRDAIYGETFEQGGLVLAGAVLFVLLIACANIANLLLARGLGRTREVAVRGALGAGRARIVRQLLTESLLIAVLGGLAGLFVAHLGIDLLVTHVLPEDVPGRNQLGLDGRVLAATALVSVASALLFGLVPALRSSRMDLRGALSGESTGRGAPRLSRLLIVGEISLALTLLVSSGLLIRTLVELQDVDIGLDTTDALELRVSVPAEFRAGAPEVIQFYEELRERIAGMPGVRGVAVSSGAPLGGWSTLLYSVPSLGTDVERPRRSAESRRVTPEYAEVMQMELVAGRWLTPADATGPGVAVVSEVLARQWWDTPAEAVGHTLSIGGAERQIVGVVDAGRMRGPDRDPTPALFEPFAQRPSRSGFLVVRHEGDVVGTVAGVREAVRVLEPGLSVFGIRTLEEAMEEGTGPQRAGLQIIAALAAVALVLTLVGVYGVVAYSVGRRRGEMGLRVALGASAAGLVRLELTRAVRLALVGLGAGLLLSLLAGRGLEFMLVGVSPRDPAVLIAVSALLLGAVLLASYLPAKRAGAVDPMEALKVE